MKVSYDLDIYLYHDGTYVCRVYHGVLRNKEEGTPAIKAWHERKRIYNKNERVSKKPKLSSKGANPKVKTDPKVYADPTTPFPDPNQGGYNQANSMRCVS
jgi:hypothetical protein